MKRISTRKYFCYISLVIFLLTLLNPAMAGLSIKNTTNPETVTANHSNSDNMDDYHTQHHKSYSIDQDQSQTDNDCSGFCANCVFCGFLISHPASINHIFEAIYPIAYLLNTYQINTYPVFHPPKNHIS